MNEKSLETAEVRKLDLNCIYPASEIMRLTGANKEVMKRLKSDGLEFRWLVGDQWIKAIDLWNMMEPVFNKYAKRKPDDSESDTSSSDQPGLATYAEVAEYLNVSRKTVSRLVGNEELPIIYIGPTPRIEWSELEKYLMRQRAFSKNARKRPKK